MSENKLGSYISSFSNKDWVAYNKFSKSLYSDSSDYQTIIKYIRSRKNRYNPTYMDVEYLRKNICPNVKKDTFSKTISNLCKYIEKYLIWSEVENDAMMEDSLLLQALGKRGLAVQFHKQKQKARNIKSDNLTGLWNSYYDFKAMYLMYYCNMTTGTENAKKTLKNSFEALRKFNSTINHYLALEMKNREVVLKENWIDELQNNKNKFEVNHDLSSTINHLENLKVNKDHQSYRYLKSQVRNSDLSKEIRYTILIHLRSFISYKTANGENSLRQDLIELQKYGLENDILFPNGKIPILRFINIIHSACDMNEYKWAFEFIDNYAGLVPNTPLGSMKSLGFAQIASSKGDFETVLDILSKTKYSMFDQEVRAKWLILNAIYELNKDVYTIIESNINNFRYFIKRNRKNTTYLTYICHLNTAKFLLLIAKGSNLEKVLKKINEEKNIAYQKWLRQKAIEKINKK